MFRMWKFTAHHQCMYLMWITAYGRGYCHFDNGLSHGLYGVYGASSLSQMPELIFSSEQLPVTTYIPHELPSFQRTILVNSDYTGPSSVASTRISDVSPLAFGDSAQIPSIGRGYNQLRHMVLTQSQPGYAHLDAQFQGEPAVGLDSTTVRGHPNVSLHNPAYANMHEVATCSAAVPANIPTSPYVQQKMYPNREVHYPPSSMHHITEQEHFANDEENNSATAQGKDETVRNKGCDPQKTLSGDRNVDVKQTVQEADEKVDEQPQNQIGGQLSEPEEHGLTDSDQSNVLHDSSNMQEKHDSTQNDLERKNATEKTSEETANCSSNETPIKGGVAYNKMKNEPENYVDPKSKRQKSGDNKMDQESITVHFYAVVSQDFELNVNEDCVYIHFENEELDDCPMGCQKYVLPSP